MISYLTIIPHDALGIILNNLNGKAFWNLYRTCKELHTYMRNHFQITQEFRKMLIEAADPRALCLKNLAERRFQVLELKYTLQENACVLPHDDRFLVVGKRYRVIKLEESETGPSFYNYYECGFKRNGFDFYNQDESIQTQYNYDKFQIKSKIITYFDGYVNKVISFDRFELIDSIIKIKSPNGKQEIKPKGISNDIAIAHGHLLVATKVGLYVYNLQTLDHYVLPSILAEQIVSINNGSYLACKNAENKVNFISWLTR